jgi:hypothetical protein
MKSNNPYDHQRYIDEQCHGKDLSAQIGDIMQTLLSMLKENDQSQSRGKSAVLLLDSARAALRRSPWRPRIDSIFETPPHVTKTPSS